MKHEVELVLGDSLEVLRARATNSATALVTDPPYGLSFMGAAWDSALPSLELWREIVRVLRPGAHALVFGAPRTFHRLACALEDAGLEIRDCLVWLHGQGFPKSLDVAKAIDRRRHDRAEVLEVTSWIRERRDARGLTNEEIDKAFGLNGMAGHWTSSASQPAVPTLEQVPRLLELLDEPDPPARIRELLLELNGRKGEPGPNWSKRPKIGEREAPDGRDSPLPMVRASAARYVPDARVVRPQFAGEDAPRRLIELTTAATEESRTWEGYGTGLRPSWEPILLARKPLEGTTAETCLAHGTGALNLEDCRLSQEGLREVTQGRGRHGNDGWGMGRNRYAIPTGRWPTNALLDEPAAELLDRQALGASRFFYVAKASDRDILPEEDLALFGERHERVRNDHPTLKPVELVRWLVRLVRVPGANLVLDPFAGSGTTGVGCALEGVPALLVELEPAWIELARARLARP